MSEDCIGSVDLPDDSILGRDDYIRMAVVASGQVASDILEVLGQKDRVRTSELASELRYDDEEVASTLKALKRVALVRLGQDPGFGVYCVITEMGQVILDEGVESGVRRLAQSENAFEEEYNDG